MRYLIQITALLALSSCTISISQVHSQGGEDIIDNNQKADADVRPKFTIPFKI